MKVKKEKTINTISSFNDSNEELLCGGCKHYAFEECDIHCGVERDEDSAACDEYEPGENIKK